MRAVLSAADVADLAREAGLADIADDLAALARPSLRLLDEPGLPEPPVGGTRLGGLPDLPADVAWPHPPWPAGEREAMTFFGQVALAITGPTAPPRAAPAARHARRRAAARRRVRGRPPRPDDARLVGPEDEALRVLVRPAGHGDEKKYWALEMSLRGGQGIEDWRAEHRMLGWPRLEQDDVFVDLASMRLEAEGIPYDTAEMVAQARDWRLLLQVDSFGLGTSFGDGGHLYFGILADDLAAGRFDRVQAASQCS